MRCWLHVDVSLSLGWASSTLQRLAGSVFRLTTELLGPEGQPRGEQKSVLLLHGVLSPKPVLHLKAPGGSGCELAWELGYSCSPQALEETCWEGCAGHPSAPEQWTSRAVLGGRRHILGNLGVPREPLELHPSLSPSTPHPGWATLREKRSQVGSVAVLRQVMAAELGPAQAASHQKASRTRVCGVGPPGLGGLIVGILQALEAKGLGVQPGFLIGGARQWLSFPSKGHPEVSSSHE